MPKVEEKIYCIYEREWEILMAMAGIENCFGLKFQEKQQEKEEIIHTLHQMIRKGMLYIENEKMKITADYAAWLEYIKQAKRAFHLMQRQEEGWEQRFAYMGKMVTVFSCSKTRKNAFEIRSVEKKNWINYLWEIEMFPIYQTECDCSMIEEVSMSYRESFEMMLVKNITTIMAEIDMKKGEEIGWIAFGEEDGLQFLLLQMETTKKIPYTMENLQNVFRSNV